MTKNYLINLIQNQKSLPPGPLFMSPDGIFTSLRREVIEKKPHLLKIPLLTELKNLFPKGLKPFYAGFGNRETDAISYRYLDIPLNRCFIINPLSEVVQLGKTKKTTYQEIADNIDVDFPKVAEGEIDISENEDSRSRSNSNYSEMSENNNIITSKVDEDGTITIKVGS